MMSTYSFTYYFYSIWIIINDKPVDFLEKLVQSCILKKNLLITLGLDLKTLNLGWSLI